MFDIPPAIQTELDALREADKRHDSAISRLETDMAEIRETLGNTATKEDIAGLRTHVSESINGILRDALNALPMRQSVFWGAVVALATVGWLLVTLIRP